MPLYRLGEDGVYSPLIYLLIDQADAHEYGYHDAEQRYGGQAEIFYDLGVVRDGQGGEIYGASYHKKGEDEEVVQDSVPDRLPEGVEEDGV